MKRLHELFLMQPLHFKESKAAKCKVIAQAGNSHAIHCVCKGEQLCSNALTRLLTVQA